VERHPIELLACRSPAVFCHLPHTESKLLLFRRSWPMTCIAIFLSKYLRMVYKSLEESGVNARMDKGDNGELNRPPALKLFQARHPISLADTDLLVSIPPYPLSQLVFACPCMRVFQQVSAIEGTLRDDSLPFPPTGDSSLPRSDVNPPMRPVARYCYAKGQCVPVWPYARCGQS